MRSEVFSQTETQVPGLALQNSKMLRVGLSGEFIARQGSMVAYQGNMEFDYLGSGGVGKFLKKAMTGEGTPLMKVKGTGDVFLADLARNVHVIDLEGDSLTVNGRNVLAFDSTISWDIGRVQGAGMAAGGLFNMVLTGVGRVAITTDGDPVALVVDAPTFVDTNAVVAWSSGLQTSLKKSFKIQGLVGRGSGEAIQLEFNGQGFVLVQPSEGYTPIQ